MGYNYTDLNFAAFVFLYSDWLTTNMGMIKSANLWTASIFQNLSLKFTSKNEMHNLRYCKLSYSYAAITITIVQSLSQIVCFRLLNGNEDR